MARVLVVDDVRDSAESLALLCRLLGHETRVAYNGAQAVEEAQRFAAEIVLMDIEMPVMDGCEAAQRILSSMRCKVFAVTAFSENYLDQRCRNVGFHGFYRKPVEVDDVVELLLS